MNVTLTSRPTKYAKKNMARVLVIAGTALFAGACAVSETVYNARPSPPPPAVEYPQIGQLPSNRPDELMTPEEKEAELKRLQDLQKTHQKKTKQQIQNQ